MDVGYGTLDYRLRTDPRVTVMERTNARALTAEMLRTALGEDATELPDLAVVDVSFISLAKVLGAVLGCLAGGYDVLALVKPQFEVGRGRVGKGGVVRDPADRREALVAVGRGGAAARRGGAAATTPPGCRGRRATARRSSGSAEPARAAARVDCGRAREPGARGRAVREMTVLTHRRPDDTHGPLQRLLAAAAARPA